MFARAIALLSFAAVAAADTQTTVAVLEIGNGGVVRRTTSSSPKTSVKGVTSFWNSLHEIDSPNSHKLSKAQQPGMTVVPDLFSKAHSGIVLGLTGSGMSLDSMPFVSGLLQGSIGHFEVAGKQGRKLLESVSNVETTENFSIVLPLTEKSLSGNNFLHASSLNIDDAEAAKKADSQIGKMLKSLKTKAKDTGKTVVLHIVVEEDGSAHRRLATRELEEDEDKDDADDDANNNYNGYYGWGYYDDYGTWITNYKTIFQIQYYNVILWTGIGLFIVFYASIMMTVNMPLEPDTLLFGESAKMVG